MLELLTADYTFLDERLANHYGIRNVRGDDFRRVSYPDERRRGLLGHGSVLTLTSHASRTSPVLRGKWIMEVLLGSPPPPPPPNVPELDEAGEAVGGRLLSVREQMEKHRADPTCNSCHRMIDPLGLALENFDATGAWRIRDRGVDVDASGELYDGTPLHGPDDLREALLTRSTSLIRTFTENLMAYALGRRVEYYDMPAVRAIERDAAAHDNRMSAFILGVVKSPAFRMKAAARSCRARERRAIVGGQNDEYRGNPYRKAHSPAHVFARRGRHRGATVSGRDGACRESSGNRDGDIARADSSRRHRDGPRRRR